MANNRNVKRGESLGARAAFGRGARIALLIAFALLVVFRLPQAWVHGRFLDEEATVFLAYAWHHPWLDALFRPFAGYWNVGANATTLLVARLVQGGIVPLERAPYLTMTMALAVQLLPALLILTGRARWLANRAAVIAALLVVAASPGTEEVFFNVLHIQFHLALCVGLILALDVPTGRFARVGYALMLFFAPLCGPGSIVLLPLFALRALIDRDRGRIEQIAAFAAGTAVQLLLFFGSNPMRGHLAHPATLAATMFVRLLVMPMLGYGKADRAGDLIYASQISGGVAWWCAAAAAILMFGVLIVVAARRRDAAIWLVLSGLGIAAASFGYGMVIIDPRDIYFINAGGRYNFLPLVFLGLALIVLARRPSFRGQWAIFLICILCLIEAAVRYPKPTSSMAQGPSWPAEVAAWHRDHRHPLAVWPGPWAADLSDEARDCTPIGPDPTKSSDPRYCESEWVASFYRTHPKIKPPGSGG